MESSHRSLLSLLTPLPPRRAGRAASKARQAVQEMEAFRSTLVTVRQQDIMQVMHQLNVVSILFCGSPLGRDRHNLPTDPANRHIDASIALPESIVLLLFAAHSETRRVSRDPDGAVQRLLLGLYNRHHLEASSALGGGCHCKPMMDHHDGLLC